MKGLLRRLSRVGDASEYRALRPEKEEEEEEIAGGGRGRRRGGGGGEGGEVPVCVGEEMARFAVPAELLGRPAFVELLRRAAAEYGYEHPGVLRIPCPVPLFLSVLRSLSTTTTTPTAAAADDDDDHRPPPPPPPELFWCLRSPSPSPPSR
ncbi:Auxin-responsive protein SAUR71 [Ananas comosus]|uniref:Auxin-responsive protein SAUR71 n=1 Tax=Ananas comosus TaxID=4615 RepID=A0A199V344_ANACO|nr:Auxin-responsive protein SAUR71 [Ananas comosus]